MKPVSVLLVDDDEDDYILTRDIFADIPKRENYKLSWVNNYEEAINAMLKSHYDIYLVDYRLGKYTGLDLLHEAIKSNVDEPIIILTGKGDAKVDEDALETGAADYLVKDQISPYAIERSIRYALKHKRALKALRESENKFRIIFERSKEPFLIMDSLGGIRDVNHAGLKLLGYGKEELLELNGTQLFYNRKQAIDFSDALDRNGAINDFQTELISRDHEIKKVSISAFLQIDQHATEELYYCIIHDISGRLEAEKTAVTTEKAAVTARVAKSLANEITNPLSNINLSLDQLNLELNSEDNEAVKLYLDILKANTERISLLISDFVNATQIVELTAEPRALTVMLNESLDLLQSQFEKQGVQVHQQQQDENIFINADYERIVNAFSNILSNSLEAGATEINVNVLKEGNYAVIELHDNGHGISDENKSHVFEPFFTTKSRGTGLGLTDVQKTVINHKGKINFTSKEGAGTVFTLKLPLSTQSLNWDV